MPELPLPTGDTPIWGGDLPVTTSDDVLEVLPAPIRRPETAVVRDAFCEAFGEGFLEYQRRSEYAAAQCDPLRAEGLYLADLAEEREVVRGPGESEASLRSRLWLAPTIVTPDAVAAAVNALLAPYTTKTCKISEIELDGWFNYSGTEYDGGFIGVSPRYPDRLYVDDAAENDGVYIADCEPGGCIPGWGLGRSFHLRIPVIDGDDDFAFVLDPTDVDDNDVMAIGDGSDTAGAESDGTVATSVFIDLQTAQQVYDLIAGTVDSIKGQGIVWSAYVDPSI